ncbi:MAG: protein phosphatase 2C domain-containing protein [Chitinophagales bacterium]|nr:serine/threonine-protein phosphatase [Bacteroidota bacterium]MCB9044234.1 serine/threonine-protein phosphatase [Chitinophagales bacterium]
MKLKINHYTHPGQRDYQEDKFAFGEGYLLVSDGVGGHAKGNKASEIVAKTCEAAINKSLPTPETIQAWVEHLVSEILENMWKYVEQHPESHGMGATLAMVLQVEANLYSIHIGDSRVYHFASDGRIKWVSKDHSLVQELLDAAVLTPEQAADHPRKNIITRVLQGKEGHKVKAAITELATVEKGDFLLVCTDGVLEAWTDEALSVLLGSPPQNVELLIKEIAQPCIENSHDNNTAVLAKVYASEDTVLSKNTPKEMGITAKKKTKKNQSKKKKWIRWLLLAIVMAIATILFGILYHNTGIKKETDSKNAESVPHKETIKTDKKNQQQKIATDSLKYKQMHRENQQQKTATDSSEYKQMHRKNTEI